MTVYETNEPKLPARDGMVTAGNDGTGIFFQNTGDDFFNRIIAGVMLKSPMSPPFRLSMILTCMMTLFGFIMAEMLRMAFGPKREPERKELPVSKGAPAIAKSSPPAESTYCILIKVPMLQNLGDDKALAGCLTSDISLSSLWIESDL